MKYSDTTNDEQYNDIKVNKRNNKGRPNTRCFFNIMPSLKYIQVYGDVVYITDIRSSNPNSDLNQSGHLNEAQGRPELER